MENLFGTLIVTIRLFMLQKQCVIITREENQTTFQCYMWLMKVFIIENS